MPFIILFVLFPLAEIMVFIQISHMIGFGTAFVVEILLAVFGVGIIQNKGLAALFSARGAIKGREMLPEDLFDDVCSVFAGVLFIIPGFITDAIAILLLIPLVRKRLLRKIAGGTTFSYSEFRMDRRHSRQDPDVIDVEYEQITKEEDQ